MSAVETLQRVPIDSIKVVSRYRRDLGDVSSLAKSIVEIGLLNPITVTADYRLIAGERRLAAHKSLGLADIECHVVGTITEARDMLVAERDENTQRKEMLPSEAAALGMAIEALERPKALERMHATLKRGPDSPARVPGPERELRPRDIAAEAVGMSEPTYRRVKQAIETAADESQPEPVRDAARTAIRDIDAGRPIRRAVETIRQAKEEHDVSTDAKPRPAESKKSGGRSAFPKDAEVLATLAMSLQGLSMGLERIASRELDHSLTAEKAGDLTADLSRSIRTFNRIVKQLNDRKNA